MPLTKRKNGWHRRVWDDCNVLNRGEVVYAVWATGTEQVKVGTTAGNPRMRMQDLQTGNAAELKLLAWTAHINESVAHRRLQDLRIRGEWFLLHRSLLVELSTWDFVDEPLYLELLPKCKNTRLPTLRKAAEPQAAARVDNYRRGESSSRSKLTDEMVREIRATYQPRSPTHGLNALVDKYGVSRSVIFAVISGRRWAHVQ